MSNINCQRKGYRPSVIGAMRRAGTPPAEHMPRSGTRQPSGRPVSFKPTANGKLDATSIFATSMRPCRQSVGATLPARAPANKDSRTFLHARLALGNDVLEPCKAIIDRRLWPDEYKNHGTSVARARKPIADYRKAVGQSEGLAGLTVFYCERAWGSAMRSACRKIATSTCWRGCSSRL